jgi:hypothetical protein
METPRAEVIPDAPPKKGESKEKPQEKSNAPK